MGGKTVCNTLRTRIIQTVTIVLLGNFQFVLIKSNLAKNINMKKTFIFLN